MPTQTKIIELLSELATLLKRNGEFNLAGIIEETISPGAEDATVFLESNDLWGGAGSIADQAGFENQGRGNLRKEIERLLVSIGEEQIRIGKVNPRTEGWVAAFKERQRNGI